MAVAAGLPGGIFLETTQHEDLRSSLTGSTTGNDDGENTSGAFASKPSHWNHCPDRKLPCCGSALSFRHYHGTFSCASTATERLLRRCPIPKTTRKAPSGVRTSSPATSGIAASAVTASSTQRRYANTSRVRTTKTCRRVFTNTSGAQFGTERKSHDLPPRPIVGPRSRI